MRAKKITSVITGVVVMAAIIGCVGGGPANASEVRGTISAGQEVGPDIVASANSVNDENTRQLDLVYDGVNWSARTFDFSAAVKAGADEQFALEFAKGFGANGGTVTNGPIQVTHASEFRALSSCRGQTRIWSDWIGLHWRADSCTATVIASELAMGAGFAAIAGVVAAKFDLPEGAAVSAIVGAILAIGSAAITACNARGTGVEAVGWGAICWAQ